MTRDRIKGFQHKLSRTQDEVLRQRARDLNAAYPAMVGRVFANPTVPTSTGKFFSVHPVDVSGVESESGRGLLTPDPSRSFLVYVIGSQAPVAGDDLVCRFVGHRWVSQRMTTKPTGVTVAGCPCVLTPPTLHMTSSNPSSNNQILRSCDFQYQATPTCLNPLGIGAKAYLSTVQFQDLTTGDSFWYHLTCYIGYYLLTRLYCQSVYGSPFRDTVRYSWLVGLPGNTCKPFLLSKGQIFAGGDPSCVVTISQ